MRLLVLLVSGVFTGWPRFCLVIETLGLTIDLAIGGMVSIDRKVASNLLEWFL